MAAVPGPAFWAHRLLAETDRSDIDGFDLDPELIALLGGEPEGQRDDYTSFVAESREQIGALAAELRGMGADAGCAQRRGVR